MLRLLVQVVRVIRTMIEVPLLLLVKENKESVRHTREQASTAKTEKRSQMGGAMKTRTHSNTYKETETGRERRREIERLIEKERQRARQRSNQRTRSESCLYYRYHQHSCHRALALYKYHISSTHKHVALHRVDYTRMLSCCCCEWNRPTSAHPMIFPHTRVRKYVDFAYRHRSTTIYRQFQRSPTPTVCSSSSTSY